MALLEDIRAQYPWLTLIGLDEYLIGVLREGATIDEALAKIRQTPQYKARFPGLLNPDGTRRFSEGEYINEEGRYKAVLQEFNAFDPNQASPFDYLGFIDNGISPEQLRQRWQVYRALERGSSELRDAMFIYAGMEVSVDDLYTSIVSTDFREQMISTYDEAVASSDLDYETFIQRSTQRGLKRVTETLRNMQTLGLVTGAAVSQMLSIDPRFAQEMMGALFQNPGDVSRTLSIDELLSSFD